MIDVVNGQRHRLSVDTLVLPQPICVQLFFVATVFPQLCIAHFQIVGRTLEFFSYFLKKKVCLITNQ